MAAAIIALLLLALGAPGGRPGKALSAPESASERRAIMVPDAAFVAAQLGQVRKLLEAAWKTVEGVEIPPPSGESPGPHHLWLLGITAPFPLAWPPDGSGRLAYYGTASRLDMGLADAHRQAAPWARVEVVADGSAEPRLELLETKVREAGIQGVRPMTAEERALHDAAKDAIEQLYALSLQRIEGDFSAAAVKLRYRMWMEANFVLTRELRPRHPEFFTWVKQP